MASFGLDGEGGPTWRGTPDPVILPGVLASDPVLATRVQALLDGAYADARRAAVEALARVLIERRALDDGEAAAIVAGDTVNARFADDNRVRRFHLSHETNNPDQGVVHVGQPIGEALLGNGLEEEIELIVGGQARRGVIEKITKAA